MKIHRNIKQYSEEWWNLRAGRLTASNAGTIQANGKGLDNYIYSILAEKYSNNHESYTNQAMQNGLELEPLARATFEIETGDKVEEVGMITDGDYISASPDGLIGKDGMIEIKCPSDKVFFKYLLDEKIDAGYLWQMQMQMLVAERDYCILATYNPNFDKSLIVVRVEKDLAMQEKLIMGIEKGRQIIIKLTKQYGNSKI